MPAGASAGAPGPATPNGAAPLGGAAARRYIQRLLRAPPSMHAALLSPCGVLLYTASLGPRDCSVRVWGLLPGGGGDGGPQPELHRTLHGHTAPVLSLALSPCGGLLLTGSYDQTVRVWSTADWHCLRVLKGHGGGVRAMAVAPDGSTLYSAAADNTIRVRGGGRTSLLLCCGAGRAASVCAARAGIEAVELCSSSSPPADPPLPPPSPPPAGLEHAALGVPAHHARQARRHHLARLPGAQPRRQPAGQRQHGPLWGQHNQGGWHGGWCMCARVACIRVARQGWEVGAGVGRQVLCVQRPEAAHHLPAATCPAQASLHLPLHAGWRCHPL